jgi:SPP1 family predicted phage head-tail adaptor
MERLLMPVDAGELTERLKVYEAVASRNDTGEATIAASLVATVWGAVRPLSSRELQQYGQQVGVTQYRVVIRNLSSLTSDMWIEYRGRKLEIASIDEHERRLYMILTCVQRHVAA